MNSDKEKLLQFMKEHNYNQSKLASKLDIKQPVISKLLNDEKQIEATPMLKYALLKTFGYDIETGKYIHNLSSSMPEEVIAIPYYPDAKAAAGAGISLPDGDTEEYLYIDKRWVKNGMGANPNTVIAIHASGDSMDSGLNKVDDIHDNDLLLVDYSSKDIINEKVFVIQQGSELRVKRLRKEFNGNIKLISNNKKEYPPEEVTKETLIVGRVIWNCSKEGV